MALTRRALGGLTIGGTAAFTLAACGGNEGGNGGSGKKELTWGIASAWESWNENTGAGNNSYGHQAMFPKTFGLDGNSSGDFQEDGSYNLNDAVWADAQVISEEPFQVEYTLTENAQWSDGKPIRVEDLIFQWYSISGNEEHANQEKAMPASTTYGSKIASIEPSEKGFIVSFVEGYKDPEWLYSPTVYLPSHVIEAEGFADWQTDPAVMGEAIAWTEANLIDVVTGPWKPVESKMGEYVVYEINENYQGSVKPTVEKLTMKVIEGTESLVTELRQGTIAGAWPSEFMQEEFDKVADDPNLKQEVYEGGVWIHVDTNVASEFLGDQALRQAVFTAINVKDSISRIFPETEVSQRLNHFFGQKSPHFVDLLTETGQGSGDVAKAADILTTAGYTGAAEGETLTTPDGKAVKLVIRYGEGDAARTTIAELAQAQLALIGIELELKAIPDGALGSVLSESDFDLVVFGWSGSPTFGSGPGQYFLTGVAYGNYSFPELDEAIGKVQSTIDVEEAAGYANDVEALAVPLALTLPFYDEPQGIFWNPGVIEGIKANGNSQAGPIYNVVEWKNA